MLTAVMFLCFNTIRNTRNQLWLAELLGIPVARTVPLILILLQTTVTVVGPPLPEEIKAGRYAGLTSKNEFDRAIDLGKPATLTIVLPAKQMDELRCLRTWHPAVHSGVSLQ